MSTNRDDIIIQCWTGKVLFEGDLNSSQVDAVLDANRCTAKHNDTEVCYECNDSGYSGDFEVFWKDSTRSNENVYEFINY